MLQIGFERCKRVMEWLKSIPRQENSGTSLDERPKEEVSHPGLPWWLTSLSPEKSRPAENRVAAFAAPRGGCCTPQTFGSA
eukprot:1023933-Pleurochrysis_carterae.AAC.1